MTKSIDQMRSLSWATRAEALKELRRHGFKEKGADYALTEADSGSWFIADLTDDVSQENVVPIKRAAHGPKPGRETLPKSKRAAQRAVVEQAEEAAALSIAREMLAEEPLLPLVPEVKEPEPGNDMSPLPADGGPYGLGSADHLAQHSIVETALAWSRKTGERIAIHAKGKVVRYIDGRLGQPVKAARTIPGGPRATGKSAEAVRLLLREGGETKAEIVAITEWSFGERYIRRLAATNKATIDTLGKDHWRLIKD